MKKIALGFLCNILMLGLVTGCSDSVTDYDDAMLRQDSSSICEADNPSWNIFKENMYRYQTKEKDNGTTITTRKVNHKYDNAYETYLLYYKSLLNLFCSEQLNI